MIAKPILSPILIDDSYAAITPHNIKKILFYQAEPFDDTNPLENLTIVDQYIVDNRLPSGFYGRKIALLEVLISLITNELMRLRQLMEISSEEECSISDVFKSIRGDGNTHNAHLIGWSWLYYRYVRIDFGISQHKFCQLVSLNDRTVRRYQNSACESLTVILIKKEWEIRQSRNWGSPKLLKDKFTKIDMKLILRLHAVLEMLRTDEDLFRALETLWEITSGDDSWSMQDVQITKELIEEFR